MTFRFLRFCFLCFGYAAASSQPFQAFSLRFFFLLLHCVSRRFRLSFRAFATPHIARFSPQDSRIFDFVRFRCRFIFSFRFRFRLLRFMPLWFVLRGPSGYFRRFILSIFQAYFRRLFHFRHSPAPPDLLQRFDAASISSLRSVSPPRRFAEFSSFFLRCLTYSFIFAFFIAVFTPLY